MTKQPIYFSSSNGWGLKTALIWTEGSKLYFQWWETIHWCPKMIYLSFCKFLWFDILTSKINHSYEQTTFCLTKTFCNYYPGSNLTKKKAFWIHYTELLPLFRFRIYRMYSDRQAWANNADPDEMLQNAASHQGLHCLPLIQQFKTLHWVVNLYLCKT